MTTSTRAEPALELCRRVVIERDDAGRVVRVDVYEPPRGVSVESRDGSEGGKSSGGGAPCT